MDSAASILDRMISEARSERLKFRRLGAKPKPAGNSNQIFAAAFAIREQALKDAKAEITGKVDTQYPYGPE